MDIWQSSSILHQFQAIQAALMASKCTGEEAAEQQAKPVRHPKANRSGQLEVEQLELRRIHAMRRAAARREPFRWREASSATNFIVTQESCFTANPLDQLDATMLPMDLSMSKTRRLGGHSLQTTRTVLDEHRAEHKPTERLPSCQEAPETVYGSRASSPSSSSTSSCCSVSSTTTCEHQDQDEELETAASRIFGLNECDNLEGEHKGVEFPRERRSPVGKRVEKGATKRSHLCRFCGRSFARSDMLTRHSRLHSGLKPYQCNRCLQVFSRSDHLSTHERTHTGEKPYQCDLCSYSACRRDMITRHRRTHIRPNRRLAPTDNSWSQSQIGPISAPF